jgi:HK97 gp10 family phage protein
MIKMKYRKKDFKKIQKSLEEVIQQVQRRGMKDALSKSAQIGLKEARARAPQDKGVLKKSLKKRARTYGKGGAFVIVGPDRRTKVMHNGKNISGAYHAHLVEFGHKLVRGGKLSKGGKVVGHVPPRPFMRPAFDTKKEEMKLKYATEVKAAIKRHAIRANKRRR